MMSGGWVLFSCFSLSPCSHTILTEEGYKTGVFQSTSVGRCMLIMKIYFIVNIALTSLFVATSHVVQLALEMTQKEASVYVQILHFMVRSWPVTLACQVDKGGK